MRQIATKTRAGLMGPRHVADVEASRDAGIITGVQDVPFPRGGIGIRPITKFDGRHRTGGARIMTYGDNKWVMVYRNSYQHSNDVGAPTEMVYSLDGGATWTDPVVIYQEPDIQVSNKQSHTFANGRIGFTAGRRGVGNDYSNAPLWMWSDDGGETWQSRVLDGVGEQPAGGWTGAGHDFIRWPASVGGHDELGWITFSSSVNDPNNTISYLRTPDNGETWETGLVVQPIEGVDLSTLSVVRLGDTDRWIMLVRQDQSPRPNFENALAFKSTDLVNWTGPYDTGQMNNANPLTAMPWNGGVYWLSTARTTGIGSRAIPPLRDGFVHQWADNERVWNSDCTDWPGWEELTNVSGMEGHPQVFWHNDIPYCVFGYIRNPEVDASGTVIGLMGVGVQWPLVPQHFAPVRATFANGWVDRYPDGRQVCEILETGLGPVDNDQGGTFVLAAAVELGDWPMPFIETPAIVGNVTRAGDNNAFSWYVTGNLSPTETSAGNAQIARTGTSGGTDYILRITATGRWY